MTDKKFTDEEIIKAIGNLFKNTDGIYELTIQNSTKGVYGEKQYYCIPEGVYNLIMRQSSFIDRQKTEIERLNKKVEDLAATQKTTKSTSGGSEMMKNLKNWTEVTRGLYRYVIAAKVCYELHILHWDFETDILTAKASVYLVGNWTQSNGNSFFEREPILTEQPVFECLEAAEKDNAENNQ